MLTKEDLIEMDPGHIIDQGTVQNPYLYHKPVRWLAVRGRIHDWAIYYGKEENSFEWIRKHGNKCFTEAVIRELVPCDDPAMKMYRF